MRTSVLLPVSMLCVSQACYAPSGAVSGVEAGASSTDLSATSSSTSSSSESTVGLPEGTSSLETSASDSTAPHASSSGPDEADCGNGIVEVGEDCDDANDVNGDGCNIDCVTSGSVLGATIDFAIDYDLPEELAGTYVDYNHVAVAPSGTISVAARILSNGQEAVLLRKFEADFEISWTDTLAAQQADDPYYAHSVDASDDLVVVCGYHGEVGYVTAFTEDGEALWLEEWGDSAAPLDCLVLEDGDVLAVGGGPMGLDLVRYRGSDGTAELFERSPMQMAYSFAHRDDGTISVAQVVPSVLSRLTENFVLIDSVPVEGVEVHRNATGPMSADYVTARNGASTVIRRYDADVLLWSHSTPALAHFSIAADSLGAVVVSGFENDDMWIRKLSPDGQVLWTATYAGNGGELDMAHSVAIAPDDTIVVAGTEMTTDGRRGWLRRYAP